MRGKNTCRLLPHHAEENRGHDTPCWIWQGKLNASGYGRLWTADGDRLAHRIYFERHVGPIAPGHELHHVCEVRDCVNPDHLQMLTRAEHARLSPSAQKTHCVNGHPYDEANTYIRTDGTRDCRACGRERVRAYLLRRKAAA